MDYVYSLLLDNHDMFYLEPDHLAALIFVPGRGLLKVVHDFTFMTSQEVYDFLFYLKRGI